MAVGSRPPSGPVRTNLLANRAAADKPLTLRSINGPEATIIQGYKTPGTTDGSADSVGPDLDGYTTWQEWRCQTNPTNALSALRLLSASPGGPKTLR
jgi:hypothetical protein